jgi:hypothetical protein
VRFAVLLTPPAAEVMVTTVGADTAAVVTLNGANVPPVGTVTAAGTDATAGLLDVSVTVTGAAAAPVR